MNLADRQLVELLLGAYRQGAFPMGAEGVDGLAGTEPGAAATAHAPVLGLAGAFAGQVDWLSVDPRSIVPLRERDGGRVTISRSLRARVRSGRFTITSDRAFEQVIRACAQAPRKNSGLDAQLAADDGARADAPLDRDLANAADADGHAHRQVDGAGRSWINAWIIDAFCKLHAAGHAHSIEAWLMPAAAGQGATGERGPILVGGLYGVHIGAAFFGESMFSKPARGGTDASKVCFVHLVHHLRRRGFALLDTQYSNPHMARLGTVEIASDAYLARLADAVDIPTVWQPFDPVQTLAELAQSATHS